MGFFDDLKRQAESFLKNSTGSAGQAAGGAAAPAPAPAAKQFPLAALPQTAEQMRSMPEFTLSNPYAVAAFTVAALNRYSESREDSKAMLNVLKGPEPLSQREIQFINDRFMDGKSYVIRSYFAGSSPENDYTPAPPYTVSVIEYQNSRENAGYIKLFLKSSGADSPRQITLRQKPSTGEWFLWEFDGILSGIRIPKSADKWA
ncbi:MAG: hypothetical protein IKZ47_02055 [Clostridia bacterium]|nr:hypothetical protein [Clostridia bacterium]